MKIFLFNIIFIAAIIFSCKEKPKSIEKTNERVSNYHVNPFMEKYVDENINVFYRSEIDQVNKKLLENKSERVTGQMYGLNKGSSTIKNLNCTIYSASARYVTDYPIYFLIKDNQNNQIYKYRRDAWGAYYGNKIYTTDEALTFITNSLITPVRPEICDIESFLNRSEALKHKLLNKDVLDSLPLPNRYSRIKNKQDLDQFWKDLNDKSFIYDQKINYLKAKSFLKVIEGRLDLPNVLVYRTAPSSPFLTYIDFTDRTYADSENKMMTDDERNYLENNLVKGNLYRIRVFTVTFAE
jgi:hypothetical protein